MSDERLCSSNYFLSKKHGFGIVLFSLKVATTKTYFRHYDIDIKTMFYVIPVIMFYVIPVITLGYFRQVTHTYPALFSIKTRFYETKNIFYVKN